MRQAALAMFVALGLWAAAEEGSLLTPRIRVPGEKGVQPEIVIPDKLLEAWKMVDADRESLKKSLDDINTKRKGYIKELEDSGKKLDDAKKNYNEVLSKLEAQQLEVQKLIETRLGAEQAKEYAIRAELQPIIDWLKLTDDQVAKITDKEKALLASDPRSKMLAAARAAREMGPPAPAKTDEERAARKAEREKQIELLTDFMKFEKNWRDAIRSELTPDQQRLWDERYRRTQHLLDAAK